MNQYFAFIPSTVSVADSEVVSTIVASSSVSSIIVPSPLVERTYRVLFGDISGVAVGLAVLCGILLTLLAIDMIVVMALVCIKCSKVTTVSVFGIRMPADSAFKMLAKVVVLLTGSVTSVACWFVFMLFRR